MKKIWKTSVVVTLAVMAFSGCGKADTFAYKQFDNIQFTGALEDSEGLGIAVGGQTGMRIQEDGSFSASYYAMDMEDTGEDYQAPASGKLQNRSGWMTIPTKQKWRALPGRKRTARAFRAACVWYTQRFTGWKKQRNL